MSILILSLLSIALSALTHIQALNWLCLIGFVLGITTWVLGRKQAQTDPAARYAKPAMLLGVIGTFANLFGILLAFVWGNLMVGGFVVF